MKLYARFYQSILKYAAYFVKWNVPKLIIGENVYEELMESLVKNKHLHILIITDKRLNELNLLHSLLTTLNKSSIRYNIYDETIENPTVSNVQNAILLYRNNHCDGIIALGGGSSIDCAKAVGAGIVCPKKQIYKMKGLLKIRRTIPPLYVIPTTAGSGSEATIAAVISNEATHEKYAISDMCLIPKYAILDANLTLNLPKQITANTGMDALTHAIEAFLGRSNTKQTRIDALTAIKIIHENLFKAYLNGNNFEARKQMQLASFHAGKAFTRAYIGNVHAMAHALGGFYNIPHGLAIAVILPYVLKYYGTTIEKNIAYLADYLELSEQNDTQTLKAGKFISWIEKMNSDMDIPSYFNEIRIEDIKLMVDRAYHEANPLYPVPMIFNKKDFEKIYLTMRNDGL